VSAALCSLTPSQLQYIHLHVTLVTTHRPHFDPAFFGLSPGTIPPTTVLTASDPDASLQPAFFSANYQGKTSEHSIEYVVKIFSPAPLDDYCLNTLFGEEPTWVLRKEWDSYPALRPTSSYAPVEPIANFHYLAAMESWVSTMETQTLSAREAVGRVAAKWWGLGMGQCGGDGKGWDWTCWE
jgi:prenylcysteine oxidase/farnesylcysteine lyase